MSPEQILATAAAFIGFGIAVNILSAAAISAQAGILGLVAIGGVLLVFGATTMMVGEGMKAIGAGFETMEKAVSKLDAGKMWSIAGAFGGLALAIGGLAAAIFVAATFAPGVALVSGLLTTLSISALLVGIGLQLAANAIQSITTSISNLVATASGEKLTAMSAGLLAISSSMGTLASAAIKFIVAIIPLSIFTDLMGSLATSFATMGTNITSTVVGITAFESTISTLLPMVDQLGLLSEAFSDLAGSIAAVGIASVIAFPAMAALGGVASLLGGLFGKEEAPAPAALFMLHGSRGGL
jgi:hypothetical protein